MRSFTLLLFVLAACGGSTGGDDAGTTPDGSTSDSSLSDATAQDASNPSDAAAPDASSDASSGGDGGLAVGQACDPNNNQCKSGLLCCSEPNLADSSSGYLCEFPVNKACPLLP